MNKELFWMENILLSKSEVTKQKNTINWLERSGATGGLNKQENEQKGNKEIEDGGNTETCKN